MTDFIISILGSGVITGIITFLLTKRKYNTEVSSNAIDNADKGLDFYVKLVENMKSQLSEVLNTNQELKKQNEDILLQVESLKDEITSIKKFTCYDETCRVRMKKLKK